MKSYCRLISSRSQIDYHSSRAHITRHNHGRHLPLVIQTRILPNVVKQQSDERYCCSLACKMQGAYAVARPTCIAESGDCYNIKYILPVIMNLISLWIVSESLASPRYAVVILNAPSDVLVDVLSPGYPSPAARTPTYLRKGCLAQVLLFLFVSRWVYRLG